MSAASSGTRARPWETAGRGWERDREAQEAGLEEEDSPPEGAEAGDTLAEYLLQLLFDAKISATSLCTIAYWATRAGAQGKVVDYALNPNSSSGHFMAKVDKVNGVRMVDVRKNMFHIDVPCLSKYDFSRSVHPMAVDPPHESLDKEVRDNPWILEETRRRTEAREWPPAFYDHCVVQRNAGEVVLPLAVYLDGISMTRNDSMIGVFVYSLTSLRRHLVAVYRKSALCKCGCGGRCSLYPLFAMMRWSFRALGDGRWPNAKHDNKAWTEQDGKRHTMAGRPLSVKAFVLFVKADWAEFTKTLGFASWASSLFPCPFCRETKEDLYKVAGFSLETSPWALLCHEDIERAMAACEVHVRLSRDQHKEVCAALRFDKGKQGARGRAVAVDLPALGLRKGDRLEATPTLLDVGSFDKITDYPVEATFWRRDSETRVAFRNPLWDSEYGVTQDSLAIDILHTLFLGPALVLAGHVLWLFIDADVWGLGAGESREGRWQNNVQHLWMMIRSYYAEQRRLNPTKKLTELENLTLNMMGSKKGSLPNFKAVETKHIMPFCVQLLRDSTNLPGERRSLLLGAASALQNMIQTLDESPVLINASVGHTLCDQYKRFMGFCTVSGVPLKPKYHLLGHLLQRSVRVGNPRLYSTFEDEGLNGVLKAIGGVAHRAVWEYRVFSSFRQREDRACLKRRRD